VLHVTKTYGKKKNVFTALDDVSFRIPDGASVAIVGKSGSGKSTLMHAMSGLDRPESGEIIIDDENILTLKQKAVDAFRSEKMSFIFQSFFVQGNESCYNNVSLPLEIARVPIKQRKRKVMNALKAVGLEDKIKSRARDLSGGQKQRLAIARAIVNEPEIIIADEPTGNLDPVNTYEVVQILKKINDLGTTVILTTHNRGVIESIGKRVITLEKGKITRDDKNGKYML